MILLMRNPTDVSLRSHEKTPHGARPHLGHGSGTSTRGEGRPRGKNTLLRVEHLGGTMPAVLFPAVPHNILLSGASNLDVNFVFHKPVY